MNGIAVACLIVLALLAGLCGGALYFFRKTVLRKKEVEGGSVHVATGTQWDLYIPLIGERKKWLAAQQTETLHITTPDGLKLSAIFLPAQEKTDKTILAVHGYQSRGRNDYSAIAPFYHNLGYNMLIVDNRAHGDSEGEYIGFGCLDSRDCLRWIDALQKRLGDGCRIFLHGISMGASTVMMLSGSPALPACVRGMICDCGFTSAWEVFAHLLKKDYHLPVFPIMHLTSLYCKIRAGYGFRDCNALDSLRKTKVPALFIHGEKDNFVPTWMGREEYKACASKKKLLIVPGAGHAESYYAQTQDYEDAVRHFLEEYSA